MTGSLNWKTVRSVIAASLALALIAGCAGAELSSAGANVVDSLSGEVEEGFARAYEPIEFAFPRDHGAHPEYRTEWWYFTGNLQDEVGERYGYQFTVFRNALTPETPPRQSSLATNQIYLAHFALTNVETQEHVYFERYSRGGGGLAGASAGLTGDSAGLTGDSGNPAFQVWLEDWSVVEETPGVLKLAASALSEDGKTYALDLILRETRPPVLHGESGLSQKGPEEGNASYYYSLVGLDTAGTVTWSGSAATVTGVSWMDHEFGSSALSDNAVGWDWFSAQLDNGDALMFAHIRTEDGGLVEEMKGTLQRQNGETITLGVDDFQLDVLDEWTSPKTGFRYPSGWRASFPELELELEITPLVRDQEMLVSFIYWEGAVAVEGAANGVPVEGTGYVELTGYGDAGADRFQR